MKYELKKIANYFENLPRGLIDQGRGNYRPNKPCCVGAHLANFLGDKIDYRDGVKAFCGAVGANRAEAILMLREAGAPKRPFGVGRWSKPPAEVFAALKKIEERPSLVGADLKGVNLEDAILEDADLGGANLEGAILEGAILKGAKLAGANLEGANLKDANVKNTILEKKENQK